jgi:SAM-dependent methyltransferase
MSARRMEEVYRRRATLHPAGYYSLARPGQLYLTQRREEALLAALARLGAFPLAGKRVLDLGSGSGDGVIRHVLYGSRAIDVTGVEIQHARLLDMRARCPGLQGVEASAEALPFPDACFDLVHQATMMTLILDSAARHRIAAEMRRVLRPSGAILWFDFRYSNPANRDARGIGVGEIRALFPGCSIRARSVGLLPPLARRLAALGFTWCRLVETVAPLRTHYLAVIRPPG